MKYLNLFLLVLLFPLLIHAQGSGNNNSEIYAKALNALNQRDTTAAIDYFNDALKYNGEARDYFLFAQLLFTRNTNNALIKASAMIDKAIAKDRKNSEYRVLKAKIFEAEFYVNPINKTHRGDALRLYEDIVEDDPKCEEAWFNIGRLNKEDYLTYLYSILGNMLEGGLSSLYTMTPSEKKIIHRKKSTYSMEKYDQFTATLPMPELSFVRVTDKMFEDSEKGYLKSIELKKNLESLKSLTELYIMGKEYTLGIELLNKFYNDKSDNQNYHLYLGMLNYLKGNIENSSENFMKAFDLMPEEEKEVYTNDTYLKLLNPEMAEEISKKDKDEIMKSFAQFMQERDPLLLSEYNERLLEHFSRVAYSTLMFSAPRINLEGWNSERGEVVIRYGIPTLIKRMRASVNFLQGENLSIRPFELMETMVFYYPDKTFSFTDFSRRGKFVFNDPNAEGYRVSQSLESTVDSILVYRKSRPEEYTPRFEGPAFYTPLNSYQMKSNAEGKTDIYFSFLINPKDSLTNKKFFDDGYKVGLFLFDDKSNALSDRVFNYPALTSDTKAAMNSLMINSAPRQGKIAFEMVRKKDKGVFSYHDRISIKNFNGNKLALSDIVMCFDVNDIAYNSYVRRNNLYLLPNPSNYFTKQMPMIIYYELYNLSMNNEKLTSFEQKISIQKIEDNGLLKNIFESLMDVVGINRKGEKITLTSKYQTIEANPVINFQIDLTKYEPGDYLITLTITDLNNGETTEAQTQIIFAEQ